MSPKHKAKIENGKISLLDPNGYKIRIKQLEGKEVFITINKASKPRSDNQNRYYWGVVIKILSEELGYLPEELHDSLRALFLTNRSEAIPIVRSTTSLTTEEFEIYLEKIRNESAKMSIIIPLPDQVTFEY